MKRLISGIFTAVALLLLLVTAAGCGKLELPPLPTNLPQGTATDVATPGPSAPSTPEPPVPLPPSPSPTAAPTPPPTPTPTPDPLSLIPPPLPENDYSQSSGRRPEISVRDYTLPEDMRQYNVQNLLGWIEVDVGVITDVTGILLNSSGETVQSCSFTPNNWQFSLAGTVNAQLSFANLTPDTYNYSVTVRAEAEDVSERIILDRSFTVYPQSSALPQKSDTGEALYSAKLTDDTDTEGIIWNFLIGEFQNPYAAAAIMGNMYAESGCHPQRLQGDLEEDCPYSRQYTAAVDNGSIDRYSFMYGYNSGGFGPGYGLCQWSGDRLGTLYDMAKALDRSVGDPETQCFVVIYELSYLYPELMESLRNSGDIYSSTMDFCNIYEQPAYRAGRSSFALKYLEKYAK